MIQQTAKFINSYPPNGRRDSTLPWRATGHQAWEVGGKGRLRLELGHDLTHLTTGQAARRAIAPPESGSTWNLSERKVRMLPHGEGDALDNLGLAYARLGEFHRAIEFYNQALVIAREIGGRYGEACTLDNLGMAYADLARPAALLSSTNRLWPFSATLVTGVGQGMCCATWAWLTIC